MRACSSIYIYICVHMYIYTHICDKYIYIVCDKYIYIYDYICILCLSYIYTFSILCIVSPHPSMRPWQAKKVGGPWALFRIFPRYPLVIFAKVRNVFCHTQVVYTVYCQVESSPKNVNKTQKKTFKSWNFQIFPASQTKWPPLWHLEDVEFCWAKLEMRAGPEVHRLCWERFKCISCWTKKNCCENKHNTQTPTLSGQK